MKKKVQDDRVSALFMYTMSTLIVMVTTGIIFSVYMLIKIAAESIQRHKDEAIACSSLDPKYGNEYFTNRGFYAFVHMKAVSLGEDTVVLQIPGSDTRVRFYCSELLEVRDQK